MPIYDYKCPSCGVVKKDVLVKDKNEVLKCSQCHETLKRLFPSSVSVHIWPADGIFLEHASAKGETFYSKKEAKEFAKKNDLEMDILE